MIDALQHSPATLQVGGLATSQPLAQNSAENSDNDNNFLNSFDNEDLDLTSDDNLGGGDAPMEDVTGIRDTKRGRGEDRHSSWM